jgi:hypothetical protein
MFSKALINQFGNERSQKIKETILAGMLWAEEQLGLGGGNEKWKKAWEKIQELLGQQGITLKEKEISYVSSLMKSHIPEINSITYSALPEAALMARNIKTFSPSTKLLIDLLREKYPKGSPGEKEKLVKGLKEKDEYLNPKFQANKTKPIIDYREVKE